MKKQRESGDHDGAPPRHVCCSLKKNSKQKHDKLGRSAAGDDLITAVEFIESRQSTASLNARIACRRPVRSDRLDTCVRITITPLRL